MTSTQTPPRRRVIFTTSVAAKVASERLTRALLDAANRGLRPHCSDPGLRELWLSEDEAERAEAIKLCAGCPVIGPCREAAEAQRETFGVFGAKDFTKRPRKPKIARAQIQIRKDNT